MRVTILTSLLYHLSRLFHSSYWHVPSIVLCLHITLVHLCIIIFDDLSSLSSVTFTSLYFKPAFHDLISSVPRLALWKQIWHQAFPSEHLSHHICYIKQTHIPQLKNYQLKTLNLQLKYPEGKITDHWSTH